MNRFKLGDFLKLTRDEVVLQDDGTYDTAGVLSFGRGLFRRPPVRGSETSYSSYFRLNKDQFVYSRLFAWEGALAVVPPEFDGLFVSAEFPTFAIQSERAIPGIRVSHLSMGAILAGSPCG
jgi:type I restriction enzyme, S subunit